MRVARISELVERHESSGEGHARVVHQEQLGSIEAEVEVESGCGGRHREAQCEEEDDNARNECAQLSQGGHREEEKPLRRRTKSEADHPNPCKEKPAGLATGR